MTPKYKTLKIPMPHCPKCDERLGGNNSMLSPWMCKCGVWEAILYPWNGEYEIIPIQKDSIVNPMSTKHE